MSEIVRQFMKISCNCLERHLQFNNFKFRETFLMLLMKNYWNNHKGFKSKRNHCNKRLYSKKNNYKQCTHKNYKNKKSLSLTLCNKSRKALTFYQMTIATHNMKCKEISSNFQICKKPFIFYKQNLWNKSRNLIRS